jgi:hypothetical protein
MSDRTGYKSRVSTVRGRARAQLSAIRKARLARKRAVPEEPGASAPEARQPQMHAVEPMAGPVHAESVAAPPRPELGEEAKPIGDAPAEAAADLDPDPQDSSGSAGTPAILAPREMVCSAAPADEPSARAQTAEDAPEIPEIPAFRDTDGPHVPPGLPLEETAASAFIAAERDPLSPAPRAPVDDGAPKGNPAPSVAEDIATGSVCPGQAMSAPPEGAEEDGLPHQAAMQGGTPAGYAIHAPVGDQGCSREMPVQHGHGWPHESAAASSRVTPEGGELAAASERDASDLHKIPGIGSGLVWMLESAGVASLEDLARSDARALGERLGTISRLLDLDYFVAQARTRTSAVGRG